MATTTATTMAYLALMAVLITGAAAQTPATAYTNHTVGGSAGWFFNSTTSAASSNFTAWATNQTFGLGDYLIFNTNTNQTVIQTYNETTYRSCSISDSSDNDTFKFAGGGNIFGVALTMAVPLTIEGPNYYFSDAEDGVQCQNGLAFEILVQHGLGLPPSLNQPPPPPYVEPPSPGEGSLSPPVAVAADPPSTGGPKSGANLNRLAFVLTIGWLLLLEK
ncbi:hypothetical protein RJ639_024961 [Escallonia herrerae]|uniref:Phytocyanin domain-containing protein n=1 Tax=Escallonia herrerae TaxID=1293975 RepID=A0AA89ACS6_9ASTE|nr:hypothetical protein RJ639_024961 [Escallonia herrerae]